MVLHPEVMRRAQRELDQIVGRERCPVLDDAEALPYVNAVVREVLRWRPIAPICESFLTS